MGISIVFNRDSTMTQIILGEDSYRIDVLDKTTHSKTLLQQEQASIFALLIEREKEFSFNPDVVINYPDITDSFLKDPISYINAYVATIEGEQGRDVDEVVILTTYGNNLISPLTADGYNAEKIQMPAGPDHTFKFSKTLLNKKHQAQSCKFYLEAVNEQDEKIQATFVVKLTDRHGVLKGGMCGSLCEVDGELFAYIATVVVDKTSPKSAGSLLAKTAFHYLKEKGVNYAHLGTQTAVRFYEKQGFYTTHRIIDKLRSRLAENGNVIHNDLVIMAKKFTD